MSVGCPTDDRVRGSVATGPWAGSEVFPWLPYRDAVRRRLGSGLRSVDYFAGGGGFSHSAAMFGVRLVFAANHHQPAVEAHRLSFPDADHITANVTTVDPEDIPDCEVFLAAPECINFTSSKGKRDVSPSAVRSRCTAAEIWQVLAAKRPLVCCIENVVELLQWGGFTPWISSLELLGYVAQVVSVNSMHVGIPSSRDRIFVLLTRTGIPVPRIDFRPRGWCLTCDREVEARQVFKDTTATRSLRFKAGRYRQQYVYRCTVPGCDAMVEPYTIPVAAAIEWDRPGPRIGDRRRRLASDTVARLEDGADQHWRFPLRRAADEWVACGRPRSADGGAPVVPVAPVMAQADGTAAGRRACGPGCLGTGTASGTHNDLALPPVLMTAHFGAGSVGGERRQGVGGWTRTVEQVAGSITTKDHHSLMWLPQSLCAGVRLGDVVPDIAIEDCGLRMLSAREVLRLQDFSDMVPMPPGLSDAEIKAIAGNAVAKSAAAIALGPAIEAIGG